MCVQIRKRVGAGSSSTSAVHSRVFLTTIILSSSSTSFYSRHHWNYSRQKELPSLQPHLQLYPGDFSQVVLSPLQALRVDLVQFAEYKWSLEICNSTLNIFVTWWRRSCDFYRWSSVPSGCYNHTFLKKKLGAEILSIDVFYPLWTLEMGEECRPELLDPAERVQCNTKTCCNTITKSYHAFRRYLIWTTRSDGRKRKLPAVMFVMRYANIGWFEIST